MKKIIFPLALLVLVAACASGRSDSSLVPAQYDLGPVPSTAIGATGFSALALEVRMPLWLASSAGIQYRLRYNDPVRLYEYAGARWVGPPSVLVRQRLQQQLGQSGGSPPCLLVVDIAEFGQIFTRPDASHGLINAEARLSGKDQKLLATRHFRIERAAATQDARGGVVALSTAVDALAGEMSAWLRQLPREEGTLACRGGGR